MRVKNTVKAFRKEKRKDNLEQQIKNENVVIAKKRRHADAEIAGTEADEDFLDDKLTRKILLQAQEQRSEMDGNGDKPVKMNFKLKKSQVEESEDEAEEWSEDDEYNELDGVDCTVSNEDEAILAKFETSNAKNVSLADLIKAKLDDKNPDKPKAPASDLNPKIVEVYAKVGSLLARYKSGKLPKAFKVIANLKNWEEIIQLTKPEDWTVHAMYQATRLFASNLNAKLAQRFYRFVLLDRVRRDISENKKLNYHLYMALKKCVYKPAAFFKGILLPLIEDGCTLKEAAIVGSVIVKTSVPVLHSAAGIMKLIELEYSGAQSLILKYLMDKKYALPFRVIDSLVSYFTSFINDQREFPVLWQQSLLFFVQRYKEDLTPPQKAEILQLVSSKWHEEISPEIQRELNSSKCRGEVSKMEI